MTKLRILTSGESWWGATGRGYTVSLRDLGHEVGEVNIDHYVPQWRRRSSRLLIRLILPVAVREFNDAILREARLTKPHIFLAFKGPYVLARTLKELRTMGVRIYNYYQDTSAFAHGPILPKALPEYDCIFYSKPFWDADVRNRLKLRETVYLNHGYDDYLSKPWPLTELDRKFEVDVSVIGNQTKYKENILGDLLRLRPNLDLKIWGNRWETCQDPEVLKRWQGGPVTGESYYRALQAARINLAITSGVVPGASRGDYTTGRTFQIPACKGFMLHERNEEVLALFKEGKEIACYASVQEIAEKIDYYLAHPEERTAIAEAGYRRCVPAYSDTSRLKELLQWHREHFPEDSLSAGA
jgi:spore maturation protein CgeB